MSNKNKQFPFWRKLWFYMKAHSKHIGISIFAMGFAGVMVAAQPLIIKFLVDSGINRKNADLSEKTRWATIFIGIYIISSAVRIGSYYFGYRLMIKTIHSTLFDIRSRFFRHVQGLSYKFHDEISTGELFNYIMGSPLTNIQMFLRQFGMFLPAMLVSWVASLGALVYFDPLMTAVMLVTVMGIVVVNHRSRISIEDMTSSYMVTESTASKYVADMFHGSRTIKLHGAQDDVVMKFDNQIDQIRDKGIVLARRQFLEQAKPEMLNYLGMAIVFGVGTWSCLYRGMSVGVLMAFVMSLERIMAPLMQLLQMNLLRANAIVGLKRIEQILSYDYSTPDPLPKERVSVEIAKKNAIKENIPEFEFKNVRFVYTNTPIFDNFNCKIERGQTYGLVGASGSGKTTFTRLLLRLYDPDSGIIKLNGTDLRKYSIRELRSYFGVVPQDPFMFQMSILENIRISRPDATDSDVRDAMDKALASEFVDGLPDGWNTAVGESGFSLSGGQRQRIAIARAILTRPSCFIFDEATSALDTESEYHIQKAIEELAKDHTMFIIAHRLSTVRNADNIFVFENGKIVQKGTYNELADSDGKFRNLLNYNKERLH